MPQTGFNILIAALGSYGDTHPFLGIGRELRARGHRVTLIAPAMYQSLAQSLNLDFAPVGTIEQFDRVLNNPDVFHPRKAFPIVAQESCEMIEPFYRAIVERFEPGRTISVISTLVFGGRIAQEKLGIPTASVHLSPSIFRSDVEPPYLPGLPVRAGRPVWWNRFWWGAADLLMVDRLLGGPINRFRKSVGLGPVKRIFRDWVHSPDRVIGLFPGWFFPPPGDWPRQTVLTGFPLYDEADVTPMEDRVLKFLDGGEAPIAFTPGSAMRFGEKFFAAAVGICRRLGRRGVILSRHAEHVPGNLPAEILYVSYAPFSQLLPRCAALVHHGGIGTCAQGLAAGVPQLLTTMAHDQPDNARSLRRLGVGEEIPIGKFSPRRGAAALERLLGSSEIASNCAAVRAKCRSDDPLPQTAQLIEQLAPGAAGGIIGGR